MLGIGNSSSSHADNQGNDFLILGEGILLTLALISVKQRQNFN